MSALPLSVYNPVYIIVLNYRGAEDTISCLQSLAGLNYPDYHLIVVDNASGDGSVEQLKQFQTNFQKSFVLIESPENTGYSGGNNLGIRHVLALPQSENASIWLLNNDTTVDPDALTLMMAQAQQRGGLVGPLIMYPDGSYQQVGVKINWWTGGTRGYPQSALHDGMAVDALSGASLLLPASVFRHVGLLDERFFLYCEDVEFCLRAAQANYPLSVAINACIYHQEGASTGKISLRTQYYYKRNRLMALMPYAPPGCKITIYLYSLFRFVRSVVKSWLSPNPDRKASAHVHWLALRDYHKGVTGACPHSL